MRSVTRTVSLMSLCALLSGCWSTAIPIVGGALSALNNGISLLNYAYNREPEPSQETKRRVYEEGFRSGMRSVAVEFRTKEEMNKPYVWRPPLVSDVEMPARVINGVMIPAHTEPVIVSPGYWVRTENVPKD